MKTMTVRDVRQKWPEAERSLAEEGEIVITRDGKPVARLLPVVEEVVTPGKRFDPEENRKWREEMWGDEIFDTLTPLMESREERVLISDEAWAARNERLDGEEEASDANDDNFTEFSAASLAKWRNEVFGEEMIDSTSELMAQREDRCN